MTLPGLIAAVILSTLYGAGFHIWQGGGVRRLLFYLLASWVGFALGHFLASLIGFRFLMLGSINWGPATVGSTLALALAWFLARVRKPEETKRRPVGRR
jgi:hypothetical protein